MSKSVYYAIIISVICMSISIDLVFGGEQQVGNIYISNYQTAKMQSCLKQRGIQAVLSVYRGEQICYDRQIVPHYLYLFAKDSEDFDISQYFAESMDFIQKTRKMTNVLIHCVHGASRSVTIAAAYLIQKYRLPADDVLSMFKAKRAIVNPNLGFLQALYRLQQKHLSPLSSPTVDKNLSKSTQNQSVIQDTSQCNGFQSLSQVLEEQKSDQKLREILESRRIIENKIAALRETCLMKKDKGENSVALELKAKYKIEDMCK